MKAYLDLGNNSFRGEQSLVNGKKHYFEIRCGEKIRIDFHHPNPLLYEYKWKGIERGMTENYQAALNLAKILSDVFGSLKISILATPGQKLISDFKSSVRDLSEYANQIPSLKLISSDEDEEEVKKTKAEIRNWKIETLEKDILECYQKIDEYQLTLIKKIPLRLIRT
ncbi:MAG: hypothetical protein PHU81_04465 [Acidobacteriota bacterium]|nr:hypothetical protein [Acidobacteriota bacterium]